MYKFLFSSLGRKYLMASTGFLLVLYVIIHMFGNWKIFSGPDAINEYAHMLKHSPLMLWSFRIGLLTVAMVHIVTGLSLAIENRKSRPVGYEKKKRLKASLASITMAFSGLVVLVFIVYHILHFTVMVFHPEYATMKTTITPQPNLYQTLAPVESGQSYHDVYRMVIVAFSNPWIAGFYIFSMALLCMHLSHGIASMLQSIGFRTTRLAPYIDLTGRLIASIIFIGMSIIPSSILLASWKGSISICPSCLFK